MTTVFPGSVDSLPRPAANTKRDALGFGLHDVIDNLSDAVEALENVEFGSPTLNPIINAGLDIWQDGATFTGIANGTWGPDGFIYAKSGAVVHDLLRSTDVPTVAQAQKANYSLHLDVTTADASIAAGDFCAIATRIEGYRWKRFDQKQWSFRFWVKAAKTGVHYVYAKNSGNDRSCVIAYTVTAADTWEEKTVTFPANPSAGTWDYTNGRGIEIGWTLATGSTYHTTAGAWQTGDFKAASDQVNELDSTANNFRIALIGPPTIGPVAAPFRPVGPEIEELRAKRYHEVLGGTSNAAFASGVATSATLGDCFCPIVEKRAAPTITTSTGTVANLSIFAGPSGAVALTALSVISAAQKNALWLRGTVAGGLTNYQGLFIYTPSGNTEAVYVNSRIP